MKIAATVASTKSGHEATVSTQGSTRTVPVPAKPDNRGSAINGGEFLMLALATCYCNDIYREAARLGIEVHGVEVEASAQFTGVGLAASDVTYRARIRSDAPEGKIEQLLRETDAVAEVQNTVRAAIAVTRVPWERPA